MLDNLSFAGKAQKKGELEMGAFKYIKASFENSFKNRSEAQRLRLRAWNKQSSVVRVERPSNPIRARELGFKATNDFIVARVRTPRGKVRRQKPDLGRKPAKNRAKENPGKSWRWFAEQKAKRKFPNLCVVNSYWIGEDGQGQYYEVILCNCLDSTPKRVSKTAYSVAAPKAKPSLAAKA